MKKIKAFLIISLVLGLGFVTTAAAAPEITKVRGGFGIAATVENASGYNCEIVVEGLLSHGKQVTWTTVRNNLTSDYTIVRTHWLPPVLTLGRIDITVTIFSENWVPVDIEQRIGFIFGPFVRLV